MNTLQDYGWSESRIADWANQGFAGCRPARIIADFGNQYKIAMPDIAMARLLSASTYKMKVADIPKVGDWVAVETDLDGLITIKSILPRKSEIVRSGAGENIERQVMATNVDLAFIVQPLSHGFSIARIERFLFQLAIQDIEAVVLLNKSDQVDDVAIKRKEVESLGVKTITMSALYDDDLNKIKEYIQPGKTIVILGQSGAGKSTITNRLIGQEVQATQAIRKVDSRGRHTTVHRELFILPGGGLIIDTPGIRELQLWGDEDDLRLSFPEIAEAAAHCHYKNCSHVSEDRCAIRLGLSNGAIDTKRYAIYLNFEQELKKLKEKHNFITDRRAEWSRESIKRRRARIMRKDIDKDFDV